MKGTTLFKASSVFTDLLLLRHHAKIPGSYVLQSCTLAPEEHVHTQVPVSGQGVTKLFGLS